MPSSPKKLAVDVNSSTSAASEDDSSSGNNNNNSINANNNYSFGPIARPVMPEISPLITWQILKDAAILSCTSDPDVDFQDVLTSLSRVCCTWREVIRDPMFRKSFLSDLFDLDPLKRLRQATHPIDLLNVRPPGDRGSVFDLLGDELFVVDSVSSQFIAVYDVSPLKTLGKTADRRRRKTGTELPQLRRLDLAQAGSLRDHRIWYMKACEFNGCLYLVADYFYRLNAADGRVLARWGLLPPLNDNYIGGWMRPGMVFVCRATGHVLVVDSRYGRVLELDADGRQLKATDVRALFPGQRNFGSRHFSFAALMTSPTTCAISRARILTDANGTREVMATRSIRMRFVEGSDAAVESEQVTVVSGPFALELGETADETYNTVSFELEAKAHDRPLTWEECANETVTLVMHVCGSDLSSWKRTVKLLGVKRDCAFRSSAVDTQNGRLVVDNHERLVFYDLLRDDIE